jgi:hypothetical protein
MSQNRMISRSDHSAEKIKATVARVKYDPMPYLFMMEGGEMV